jgi:hypothetical protein
MVTDVSEEVAASSFRAYEVQEKCKGLHILKMGAANYAETPLTNCQQT